MPSARKALFAVGCFMPLFFYAVSIAVFAADGIDDDALRQAFLIFAYVGMAVYIAAMVAAIVHVARRPDFDGGQRTKWLLLIFFLNAFVLPIFWWRLIRPFPAPGQVAEQP